MLPTTIAEEIKKNFESDTFEFKAVHGGDINQGGQITLQNGFKYFIKWNMNSDPTMFAREARGLKLLSEADTDIIIPKVQLHGDTFLIMDWIEKGTEKPEASYKFGRQLARLHKHTSDHFGLDHDNFIGKLHQSNQKHSNWADFFAIERLEPQIQMAVEDGKIERSIFRTVQKLYSKLGQIFPQEKPSLLHGDLWSGNYMFLSNGNASIYDPAVYYGHREMDIGMTRLFGGFSEEFYNGYEDIFPLEHGFKERIKLCNLYPILVHANLFGGSYSRQAEQIIQHYA